MNLRLTILIRTDLQLKPGLLAAQVAHLGMEFLRLHLLDNKSIVLTPNTQEWLKAPYLFVHGVPNQESLLYFIKLAEQNSMPYSTWKDTIFLDVSEKQRIVVENTLIGVAFGPQDSDAIKVIVGDLPLLS